MSIHGPGWRCVLALVGAGCWAACCSTAPTAAETAPALEREARVDCGALSEIACIDSRDCTLRLGVSEGYVCSPPAGSCEEGFAQRSAMAEDCPAECTFVPARCYCAPDVTCICSGGPPAQCVASEPNE